MKQLQEQRFKEQIQDIMGTDNKVDLQITEDGILEQAKINTTKELDSKSITMLTAMAASWACDLYIKRSGAGIRVKFNLVAKRLSPEQQEQYKNSRLKAIPVRNARVLEGHRGH